MKTAENSQKVLLVDDEPLIAQSLAKIFRNYGFVAESATNAKDALLKLDTFHPNVLITDILMPEVDGIDLALEVAARQPSCKIILFSGHAEHADLNKLKAAEIPFLLISKPLSPTMLMKLSLAESTPKLPYEPVILLVDDNDMNRYSMARILSGAGFKVIEAASGKECVQKAASKPDAILLDVNLPDLSGFEVCRRLRDQMGTAEIPVIHVTAGVRDDASRIESLRVGANEYMTYPLDPDHLIARLRAIVQAYRSELPIARKTGS